MWTTRHDDFFSVLYKIFTSTIERNISNLISTIRLNSFNLRLLRWKWIFWFRFQPGNFTSFHDKNFRQNLLFPLRDINWMRVHYSISLESELLSNFLVFGHSFDINDTREFLIKRRAQLKFLFRFSSLCFWIKTFECGKAKTSTLIGSLVQKLMVILAKVETLFSCSHRAAARLRNCSD